MAIVGALRSGPRTTRSPFRRVKRSIGRAGFGMLAPARRVLLAGAVAGGVAGARRLAFVGVAFFAAARFAAVVFGVVAMWAPTLAPRQLGETGDQHLHHQRVRPGLLAPEVEVGFGHEGDRPPHLGAPEPARL